MVRDKQKVIKRFKRRVKAEEIIESFFRQLYTYRDTGGAREWLNSDEMELTVEKHTVLCNKVANTFKVGRDTFKYNFRSVNELCQTLLLDEV